MAIWHRTVTVDELNKMHENTMQSFCGIEFMEIGDDYIKARMPVNERTKQPHGLLHGGASVMLAESLGSIASVLCINLETHTCVGLEINANHIKAVRDGFVYGVTKPLHIGRTTMVWQTTIRNEDRRLVAVVTQTQMVLPGAREVTLS